MIRIHQIHVPVTQTLSVSHIAKKIKARPSEIHSYEIERESLDARGDHLQYIYTVLAQVSNEHRYLKLKDVTEGTKETYQLPEQLTVSTRPLVVGFGPAGMYAALILSECGLRPLIIERGKSVDERTKDVEAFFYQGLLNPESNVQYGEGGAGTFSDGKLTTRMKNIRITKVFEEFIEAGADPAIMYQHRPHLGTDQLRFIVKNIREKIIRLGGEIRFETKLEKLIIKDGAVTGAVTDKGTIETDTVLLCAGHSAADTYTSLFEQGIEIVQKDFAAGVRVEHPQAMIDQNTYGKYYGHPSLSPASYQLTARTSAGRGVYSFCMCPGGVVVPASTMEETLAVNGMSYSARDGKNANSAILVQIPRTDFDHGHPLDGFRFQKELEKKAYRDAYQAPAMNIRDFVNFLPASQAVIETSFPRGIVMEDMHALFSDAVNTALREGFLNFDRKIPGFVDQGIMVGMESRSSSPIRIPRNEDGCCESCKGLYPCGEGAGYAGGIVSSAVDGIRQAENAIRSLRNELK